LETPQTKEDQHSHPSDEDVDPHFDIFKVRARPAGKGKLLPQHQHLYPKETTKHDYAEQTDLEFLRRF
jgi:hypothetical protein